MRFELDAGSGYQRVFPETFSFHVDRHDPSELYLQLEDLWTRPRLLGATATRRDAEDLVRRLGAALPGYLERVLDRLDAEYAGGGPTLARVHEDVALATLVVYRFLADKRIDEHPAVRLPCLHLHKLRLRSLLGLVRARVSPDFLARYIAGATDLFEAGVEPSESALLKALSSDDVAEASRHVLRAAEQAYYRWLEEVCLDESNQAFEREQSPFADRESEVLAVVGGQGRRRIQRGRELAPFLRRPRNKDCVRVLEKLEAWFLRQYDVHHAAVVIQHAANLARGADDGERVLSRHSARNYLLLIALLALPFVGAAFAYQSHPLLFDLICSAEVVLVNAVAFWFLLYRFCWQRDLTFFHASVPRIGAGIIVGYFPVFLIDEIWDLARRPWFPLSVVVLLIAFATLLYIYIEVQRRIGDPSEAFARARSIFLLGVVESLALGLIVTTLFGSFMVERNWSTVGEELPVEALRSLTPPVIGELPRIVGVEPLLAFPTAVFLMTFLSFFIGTFLQLLWEDIPITEPL